MITDMKKYLILLGVGSVATVVWTTFIINSSKKKSDLSDLTVDKLELEK